MYRPRIRPTNLGRNWYLDHEKRLDDAIVAQYGIQEEGVHADGLHRWDSDLWPKPAQRR
jgi:hypothetical protein